MSAENIWKIETEADRDFRHAFGLTVVYEQAGPLLRYLDDHPERRDQAVTLLREMGGTSSMPRRIWLRKLADRIENEASDRIAALTRVTSLPDGENGRSSIAALGFCTRRGETVTNWNCKACFWEDRSLRDEFRDPGEIERPHRASCIEAHINTPRRWAERDTTIDRIGPMLDLMGPEGWRGVIANALEAALAYPEEKTSRALIRQIEAHAMKETENVRVHTERS